MKTTLLSLLCTLGTAFGLQAQIVFEDNFSSYTNGALNGQGTWSNNSSQAGLGACAGAICSGVQIVDHPTGYMGVTISNKAVQFGSDMDACGTFFTPITSGDMYMAFIVNTLTAPSSTSSNDIIRVCSGNNFNTSFRIFLKAASSSSFYVGVTKGASSNPAVFSTNGYTTGIDHIVIVKYSMGSGAADDTITVYVDPTIVASETLNPVALTNFTGTDQATSIDRFALRCNSTNLPTGFFGGLKITRTWADLFSSFAQSDFQQSAVTLQHCDLTQGTVQFSTPQSLRDVQLKVYDMKGAVVSQQQFAAIDNEAVHMQPVSSSGVYILEMMADGQKVLVQKIVK